MANMLFANNCNTTLNGGITAIATSMVVTSATGFPSPTGSQYFYCTLADAATQTTIEIVKVTAVSGTTFTIVRGQDGTTGTIFASGAVVSLRLVAASLNDFPKLDEANTFTFAPTFNTALAVGSGGTGLTSLTANYIPYGNGTSAFSNGNLTFDGTNLYVGVIANNGSYPRIFYGKNTASYYSVGYNQSNDQFIIRSELDAQNRIIFYPNYNTGATTFIANGIEAMRVSSSGGVSIGNTTDPGAGNLRFNTTGTNGIYFGSSSILTDYEEGTWTPTFSTWTINPTNVSAKYTKIGRVVTLNAAFQNGISVTGNSTISGLPYTSNANAGNTVLMKDIVGSNIVAYAVVSNNSTTINSMTGATFTGTYWALTVSYIV